VNGKASEFPIFLVEFPLVVQLVIYLTQLGAA
jgi:hypothetical protein